jgi:phosphate transport system substrate-binding protein
MHTFKSLTPVLASAVLAFGVAACGDDSSGSSGSSGGGGDTAQNLKGSIAIDGSSTVQPFAEAAVETFNEENPDVNITVGGAGTGDGFAKFCRGETQISDASRPIKPEEAAECKKGGVDYTEVQVANDGITVVTNKSMTIDCLTTDQLKGIFGPKATAAKYSDVDPKLPDKNVSLFTPGTESGTFDFFTEVINGEAGVQREKNVQTSADDNQIATGIEGEDGAMGYFGFSYFEQNQDQLNDVKIDAGDGCIEPTSQTIQDGSYKPLSRPLFMYVGNKALAKPEVKAFVHFAVDQQQQIAEASKIVPMSPDQAAKAKQALGS